MNDITKALIVFILVVAVLALVGSRIAEAGRPLNGWLPTGAVAYIGVDDDLPLGADHGVPYCHNDGNNTGVLGVRVPAYRWDGRHTITLNLEHNSCLQEEDDLTSDDRVGVRYEYRAW